MTRGEKKFVLWIGVIMAVLILSGVGASLPDKHRQKSDQEMIEEAASRLELADYCSKYPQALRCR